MTNHPNRNWRNRWANDPAAYVKEFRERHGLTQQALADRLGLNLSTITKWEASAMTPSGLLLPRALRDLERELHKNAG